MPDPLPSIRQRAFCALAVGLLAGSFSAALALREGAVPDLLYPLTAARFLLGGENPYVAMAGDPSLAPPFDAPLFYPLTTILSLTPLAGLPLAIACGLFFGLSTTLLAFLVTRDGLWRAHMFASAPFVVAATLSQFSPLMMVMALVPSAGFLAAVKPNLGLALFAYRPSWRAVISVAVFGAISLVVMPDWPRHWLGVIASDVGGGQVHAVPLLQVGGFVLALSALAWRQASGRLLLLMSITPQAMFFYDQLPLWLLPRTRKESLILTACSQLAMVLWFLLQEPGESVVRSSYPYLMALIYLPALVIVLRQWRGTTGRQAAGAEPVAGA